MRRTKGMNLFEEMARRGVTVMADSPRTLGEEMPEAYKDISAVVEVVHKAQLSLKVARLRPIAVIKG